RSAGAPGAAAPPPASEAPELCSLAEELHAAREARAARAGTVVTRRRRERCTGVLVLGHAGDR
ncbi:MAG: hypothetical protein L0H24_13980, partial [Microlunatus sp.]|nr:hypothetical protein [Microlunatus sp.]